MASHLNGTSMVDGSAPVKRPRVELGVLGLKDLTRIAQGAEGVVYQGEYHGRSVVVKVREPKAYRHPELDLRLTSRRLTAEARTLLRLRKDGVRTSCVYYVNASRGIIVMEQIAGVTLRARLDEVAGDAKGAALMAIAGGLVARIHAAGVVHGDLTTSNLLVTADEQIVPIDFGLSSTSVAEEDLAVDLYVLERAVLSTRPKEADFLNGAFFEAYRQLVQKPGVLRRLEDVRARGRKRDMVG